MSSEPLRSTTKNLFKFYSKNPSSKVNDPKIFLDFYIGAMRNPKEAFRRMQQKPQYILLSYEEFISVLQSVMPNEDFKSN